MSASELFLSDGFRTHSHEQGQISQESYPAYKLTTIVNNHSWHFRIAPCDICLLCEMKRGVGFTGRDERDDYHVLNGFVSNYSEER